MRTTNAQLTRARRQVGQAHRRRVRVDGARGDAGRSRRVLGGAQAAKPVHACPRSTSRSPTCATWKTSPPTTGTAERCATPSRSGARRSARKAAQLLRARAHTASVPIKRPSRSRLYYYVQFMQENGFYDPVESFSPIPRRSVDARCATHSSAAAMRTDHAAARRPTQHRGASSTPLVG